MRPNHFHRLLMVMGCGTLVLIFSLRLINPSAAHNAIGSSTKTLAVSIDPANLLVNPDFENGYSYPLPCCNNIAVPIGWNIRWYTDTDPYGSGYPFFQPEVKLDDNTIWPYCDGCAPNVPPRIHSGRYAVDSFKGFGSQDTSLYQQIGNIPMGAVVIGSAWLHAWVSSCNGFPKNFPPQNEISLQGPNSSIDGSCADGAWPDWSNRMMVGIDPTGGIDPRASTVVWNIGDPNNVFTPSWHGPYDYYSSTLPVTATAQSFTITLFLRGITTSGAQFSDIYFDSASLTYCCQPIL
ncbi:MAG TPA: hypothetical protein VJ508_16140, partial [Saprospiraceae bacterium]|nr:hypothetical protein [Saprospiraceae bacterium]